jgi:hypothetical protein
VAVRGKKASLILKIRHYKLNLEITVIDYQLIMKTQNENPQGNSRKTRKNIN